MADWTASGTTPETAGAGWTEPARPRGWRRLLAVLSARLEAEQDRWFLWLPVLYGLGIAAYFSLALEPHIWVALAPLAAALAIRLGWRGSMVAGLLTGATVAATLGFAAAKLRTVWVDSPMLERRIGPVEVRGFVELVEPRPKRGGRVTLRVAAIEGFDPEATPRRVRVRLTRAAESLKPGDAVRLTTMLTPHPAPALPGGHDFARAAYFDGIGGVGYALSAPRPDPAAGEPPLGLQVEAAIASLRQIISRRITTALPGERGAIADALITGERGGISEATNDAFRDSGLVHILSISGLHMTIMAGTVFLAIRVLLAAVPVIALRMPVKKLAAIAAAVAALAYLLISGGSFPTVRAWIMISIMFLAVLLDRPALSVRNVALGALAITALAPESLLEVGFQMSFAAVLALVAAYEAIRVPDDQQRGSGVSWGLRGTVLFFGGIVLATLVASAAVAPFAAYHFHKSQQYAVLANLIAIPVCNVLVMPAALATLVLMPLGLEAGPLWLMGQGIGMMVWCAETVARIPGAVAHIPAIPTASFALMVAGGLWLCLWRTRWRLLGLAVIAAGIAIAPMQARPDILVGRDGSLLAARVDGEELSAIASGGASFELQRWLDSDGDARNPRSVTSTDKFRCDALGCTAKVKGVVVSLAREPAALADDCARAGILVLTFPRPRGCRPAGLAIDFFDMHRKGTHAIYLGDGTIRMETVGDARGDRPWTRAGPRPSRGAEAVLPLGRRRAELPDARSDGSGASGTDADADEPQ